MVILRGVDILVCENCDDFFALQKKHWTLVGKKNLGKTCRKEKRGKHSELVHDSEIK